MQLRNSRQNQNVDNSGNQQGSDQPIKYIQNSPSALHPTVNNQGASTSPYQQNGYNSNSNSPSSTLYNQMYQQNAFATGYAAAQAQMQTQTKPEEKKSGALLTAVLVIMTILALVICCLFVLPTVLNYTSSNKNTRYGLHWDATYTKLVNYADENQLSLFCTTSDDTDAWKYYGYTVPVSYKTELGLNNYDMTYVAALTDDAYNLCLYFVYNPENTSSVTPELCTTLIQAFSEKWGIQPTEMSEYGAYWLADDGNALLGYYTNLKDDSLKYVPDYVSGPVIMMTVTSTAFGDSYVESRYAQILEAYNSASTATTQAQTTTPATDVPELKSNTIENNNEGYTPTQFAEDVIANYKESSGFSYLNYEVNDTEKYINIYVGDADILDARIAKYIEANDITGWAAYRKANFDVMVQSIINALVALRDDYGVSWVNNYEYDIMFVSGTGEDVYAIYANGECSLDNVALTLAGD